MSKTSSDNLPIDIQLNGLEVHPDKKNALLVEVAWEVANQVGGIYTVIRSKVPSMKANWDDRYLLIGPSVHPNVNTIFEDLEPGDDEYGRAVVKMRSMGFEVRYGEWLTAGRPKVVLFNPWSVSDRLGEIKYLLWEHHHISIPSDDDLSSQVVAFGWLVKVFLTRLTEPDVNERPVIAHIHEWMAGTAIPEIRRDRLPIHTVFTTHATMLGRYLAMNDPMFNDHLPYYDWEAEARKFNIETRVKIERAAAHGAHIFTTVSDVTSFECECLIGRKPEMILPNGINVDRFQVDHEIQNQHQKNKDLIHQFITGHFFQSYFFDLDKTLYLFTSGRYEYRNKGYDLTLEALARLNWRLKQHNVDVTVVMFFVTKKPFQSINPQVMESRATLNTIRQTTEVIQKQFGDRLLTHMYSSESGRVPDELSGFIDDNLKIKLRRTVQSWKTHQLPYIVTHNLWDDGTDEVLGFLRSANLLNHKSDKVKVVYHPDFISATSPLFRMDYDDFVRGCHLGVFPSYYEPWGYTPLECMVSGVPAITSDLAGFGDYMSGAIPDFEKIGLYLVNRRYKSFDESANQLADQLFDFVKKSRADRIAQRYQLADASERFDWKTLTNHYEAAYNEVLAATSL
ncbi:MAG: glycosyltransferase [Bacteroidia bacterium]|nr:glycosyltransferase [Bacteroidia bacterium]